MTHPPTTPSAPIVWHDDRSLLSEAQLDTIGPEIASTKTRAALVRDAMQDEYPRLPGQLWQREAEREVATYGEPRSRELHDLYFDNAAALRFMGHKDDQAGEYVARRLERRRPAMRALALKRVAPDGLPLYALEPGGSGRVGLMRRIVADVLDRASGPIPSPAQRPDGHVVSLCCCWAGNDNARRHALTCCVVTARS